MSDYSLQLALFLKSKEMKVLYCLDKRYTSMETKCNKNAIDLQHLPLHNKPIYNFFIAFLKFNRLLMKQKKLEQVFVFEGRDHTLAGLSKLFFPFLWKNKKLIRIRGQAQKVKKQPFSFLLYKYLTDKIVFTARVVQSSVPYHLPPEKTQICYYGKTEQFPTEMLHFYHFTKQNYDLYFNQEIITFFLLGRFDPIKGHDLLIEAFLKADFHKTKVQLICVGTRQNTSAQELYEKYKGSQSLTNHFKQDFLYHLSTIDDQKRILMIEEHFHDALLFMKNATFGVISSLGSETICRVGVEFLQASVPVIYSDAGALPEVFADFPEFKFERNNVHELIQKFELAYAIYQDQSKYLDLKQKSHDLWKQSYQGDVYKIFAP